MMIMKTKERRVGTVSRGIRCPIIREGDNLSAIVTESVLEAAESEGFVLHDRDVIAVTESVVARAQGNYASVDEIAEDVRTKLGGETIGVIFPILSRNRFAVCLRGIAMGAKKIILMLNYPSDEVGNELVSLEKIDACGINPYSDVLTLEQYRRYFGHDVHEFTGIDYIDYYRSLILECGAEVEILFANQAKTILQYTDHVLTCDIHTRARTKRILKEAGAKVVCGLDDLMNAPVSGSGYNEKYGLLGSNKSTETRVKLFPRDCRPLVLDIQERILKASGVHVEVMVYGDGAFKDPKGKIWELADPVVSPAYTDGLIGTPNELKLKYLADNDFKELSGEALKKAISERIREKDGSLVGTLNIADTDEKEIVKMMVGRDIADVFPHKKDKENNKTIFSVNNLSFGDKVKNVSFELHEGEIIGVAGIQGHGQAELLKVIAGVEKASSGDIVLNGEKLRIQTPQQGIKKGIGYIPGDRKQEGLMLEASVRDNLSIVSLHLRKNSIGFIDFKKEKQFTDEAIKSLKIKTPNEDQYVNRLSGGNQQKVVLGKEIATNPKLLLFDEPTRGIDVATKQEFYRMMREFANKGVAVIMYSSDLLEVVGLSDKVLAMYEGEIISEITGEDITEENIMMASVGIKEDKK